MQSAVTQRVVALVDMDCFYCQVETKLNPCFKSKPLAVVQYNQWKGGGIIAVNYEARARGVSRHMRGDEAKEICPEIILVPVPTIRGKADLTKYRDAGDEVAKVFSEFSECVQRASIDEAYLDLTKAVDDWIKSQKNDLKPSDLPNTFVLGYCNLKNTSEEERGKGLSEWLIATESEKTVDNSAYKLAIGGVIVEKMRREIFEKTGFHCSAGIAHNKILAKLTAGLHKPNKQTILPQDSIAELYETLPIYKVRNLGGKLGKEVAQKLSIKYMSEVYKYSLQELKQRFDEKTSTWLYNIARGIDLEPVTSRLMPESIGCCKNFSGKSNLTKKSEVEHWLKELATEISERLCKDLIKNKRRAKLLTVSFYQESAMTRCGPLNSYEVGKIVNDALDLIKRFNTASSYLDSWNPPLKYLGLSASKFSEEKTSIEKFFKSCSKNISPKVDTSILDIFEPHEEMDGKTSSSPELIQNCTTSYKSDENKNYEARSSLGNDKNCIASTSINLNENCEKLIASYGKQNSVASPGFETLVTEKINSCTESPKPKSFFLEFLKQRKNITNTVQNENSETEMENENRDEWISLTEVFPDFKKADKEVIDILPEPLQAKMKERLKLEKKNNFTNENTSFFGSASQENALADTKTKVENDCEVETCAECEKVVPLNEFWEHLDYHAAVKLYMEINKPINVGISERNVKRVTIDNDTHNKRKRKKVVTPSKKMKSITSFFSVVPK